MKVAIITPEKPVFIGECDSAILPAYDGLMGVMPGHESYITRLGIGPVTLTNAVTDEGESRGTARFVVREGFLQVSQEGVSLLARDAVAADDVNVSAAKEKLATVADAYAGQVSDEDHPGLQADRAWSEARLALTAH